MGFCCCATWYSNWMLNRDFRLMIRVECISPFVYLRSCVTQTGSASIPETNRGESRGIVASPFFPPPPLLWFSARRVNSICSDKQRPNMALIPCNWGWITICSPTLHKGVYSSTVFERVEWTRQSVSVRVAGVLSHDYFLISEIWFFCVLLYTYIQIYTSPRNSFPIKSFLETRFSIDQ